MKKVCFIVPAVYPLLKKSEEIQSAGGAEAQFMTIGLRLQEYGYEVHFIVDDYGQQDTEKINQVITHKLAFRYLGGSKRHIVVDWLRLIILLRKIRADFHVLKVPKELLVPVGFFCRLFRSKLIYVGQSDKDVDIKLLFKLQNRASVFLYRLGLLFADYAVAQTAVQLNGFRKMGLEASQIKNTLTLPPNNSSKEDYLLWVGNSTPNKQPELFLKLAQKLPQYSFKMIHAPSLQGAQDKRFHDASDKIPNIEYISFVPFHRISEYFCRARLFVSTSLREGFPNTFLQAWQYGTPVVSLHVDPDGVIGNYHLGKVSNTFDRLCGDVVELMENENFRNDMGENAKRYVYENHSIEMVVPQYLKLFESLNG